MISSTASDLLENHALRELFRGGFANHLTEDETKVLCALTFFTHPTTIKHIQALTPPLSDEVRALVAWEFEDWDAMFDSAVEATTEGASRSLTEAEVESTMCSLASRSLVIADQKEQSFALVPRIAQFLERQNPEIIAETRIRLEKQAYALVVENGYQEHDRFPVLNASWPIIAAALPCFLVGPNERLQTVCDALTDFFNFTGRWDEYIALSGDAETRALTVQDFSNAGWRAFHAALVHRQRGQFTEFLACAARANTHWHPARVGAHEWTAAIRLRGLRHRLAEDYPAAIMAYREALALHQTLDDESEDIAIGLNDLAEAEAASGDLNAAERDYGEGLRIAQAVDHRELVAVITGNLASLALIREEWRDAETLARESLSFSEKIGRLELIAGDDYRLAKALMRQGKAAEALPHARRAVEIYTRLGLPDLAEPQLTLAECETSLSPP